MDGFPKLQWMPGSLQLFPSATQSPITHPLLWLPLSGTAEPQSTDINLQEGPGLGLCVN